MNPIASILSLDRTRCLINASSKKKALEIIAETIANTTTLEARDIFDGMVARERLGSTGLGRGIAIPHTRIDNINEPLGCFVSLQEGVEYHAEDNKPVDLLFALIVPTDATEEHLQLLAAIARLFRDETFNDKLRHCTSRTDLFQWILDAGN